MKLKRDVEKGRLKPLIVLDLVPLCSAQYERLFGTTRIPGIEAGVCVGVCVGGWMCVRVCMHVCMCV